MPANAQFYRGKKQLIIHFLIQNKQLNRCLSIDHVVFQNHVIN